MTRPQVGANREWAMPHPTALTTIATDGETSVKSADKTDAMISVSTTGATTTTPNSIIHPDPKSGTSRGAVLPTSARMPWTVADSRMLPTNVNK